AWFGGWPPGLPAAAPALALAALVCGRAWSLSLGAAGPGGAGGRVPRPRPETLACVIAAVAYRLPALLYPWGWVNTDGAYGGFVALHLLEGIRPAPVFTEGANYQGTLKGHL